MRLGAGHETGSASSELYWRASLCEPVSHPASHPANQPTHCHARRKTRRHGEGEPGWWLHMKTLAEASGVRSEAGVVVRGSWGWSGVETGAGGNLGACGSVGEVRRLSCESRSHRRDFPEQPCARPKSASNFQPRRPRRTKIVLPTVGYSSAADHERPRLYTLRGPCRPGAPTRLHPTATVAPAVDEPCGVRTPAGDDSRAAAPCSCGLPDGCSQRGTTTA